MSISGPSSVDEGDATTAYTVSLSPSGVTPTADLAVSYATSNGTATAGSDYTAKSGTLTFTSTAAGAQTFTVQTTDDAIDEGTGETFTVTISSPSGSGGPAPSLGASSLSHHHHGRRRRAVGHHAERESVEPGRGRLSHFGDRHRHPGRRHHPDVSDGGDHRYAGGSATKDTDYSATSLASITIPANTASGSGTITITPTDDEVVEGDETITIPGSTATQVGLTVSDATVTLTDDNKTTTTDTDDKDSAELRISGPASSVSEGSNAVFTVTLSKAVAVQVQVAWSAPLGTDAAESADLGSTSGTVTFAANSAAGATQTITITATDDALSGDG